MKNVQREYLPKDSVFPFRGLSTLEPTTQLDPSLSPTFTNFLPNKGLVAKRRGYQALGGGLDGIPMALINFTLPNGTEYLVCVTTTKEYKFNTGTIAWDDITVAATNKTGGENDTISWTVATGTQGTWLIITNGKDKPRYWNGTGAFDLLENATGWTYTGFVTCKALAMFYNHLVFVNVTLASASPFAIAWSDADSLVNFEAGTSGTISVSDSRGTLQQCIALGDRLIIYSEDSIGTLTYVGSDIIFIYETTIQDSRLLSTRGIVNLGPYHLLMREETISVYDGTRLLIDAGDAIFRTYRSEIDLSSPLHAFAFLDRARSRVYFAVPTSSTSTVFYMLEFDSKDMRQSKWCRLEFALRVTSMGFYSRDTSLTWDSAALSGVTWAEVAFSWDSGSARKGFPVMVLGLSNSTVQQFDDIRATDGGTVIDATCDSPDFTADASLSLYGRWVEIELSLLGTDAEIYYSTDKGGSWILAQTLTLTSQYTRYVVNVDVTALTFRVRVRNKSSGYCEMEWRRVWVQPAGAR